MLFQFSITTCVCMCLVHYNFVNGCMHLLLIDSPNKPKCLHWNNVLYFLHATELDAFQFGIYCCSRDGHFSLPPITPGVNRVMLCQFSLQTSYHWLMSLEKGGQSCTSECVFRHLHRQLLLKILQQNTELSATHTGFSEGFLPWSQAIMKGIFQNQPLLVYICSYQNHCLLDSYSRNEN